MPAKYLALSAIVFLACTFSPTPVAALSIDSYGLHARHAHIGQALAKRAPKRCKPRSPQANNDPTTSPAPTVTPAPNQNTPAPPASTPATQPPSSGGYGNGKPGLAVAEWGDTTLQVLTNFRTDKVSTYYNWGPWKTQGSDYLQYEFVPMLSNAQDDTIRQFQTLVVPGYSNHILGFNEPDLNGLSAGAAAEVWNRVVRPLRGSGYSLVSPALTSTPNSIQWMRDFLSACGGDCVDKIAVHWYGLPANEFISYLQLWYDTFQKPIWVTEFACTDFVNHAPCPNAYEFAAAVKGFMDNTWWIEHYFPFVVSNDMKDVDDRNRLLSGTARTPLADLYFT